MNYKVCHITTAHPRNDIRIFLKQCRSLAKNNYQTHLVVADDLADEIKDGVQIISIGKPKSRLSRMAMFPLKALRKAISLKADIYHIHDPEIYWLAIPLKLTGKKVVVDLHEDFPSQIKSKHYLAKPVRSILSVLASVYEKIVFSFVNGIATATPHIAKINKGSHHNVMAINNYPLTEEFQTRSEWEEKERAVCYIGGLTYIRGIKFLIEAFANSDITLYIAGPISDNRCIEIMDKAAAYKNIHYLGTLKRKDVQQVLNKSVAGILTYLPEPNHVFAMPNKLFEYMSAGLPVIASNFPVWKEIIHDNNCGIVVDPSNPAEILKAAEQLVADLAGSNERGNSGRRVIESTYNWDIEEDKLVNFYKEILA